MWLVQAAVMGSTKFVRVTSREMSTYRSDTTVVPSKCKVKLVASILIVCCYLELKHTHLGD